MVGNIEVQANVGPFVNDVPIKSSGLRQLSEGSWDRWEQTEGFFDAILEVC